MLIQLICLATTPMFMEGSCVWEMYFKQSHTLELIPSHPLLIKGRIIVKAL